MSLATNDTESVRMFFGIGLLLFLDTFFYFVLVPIYMTSISWKLTLASIAPLPLIPIIVAKLTHVVEHRYDAVQAQFAKVSERARESFAGVRVVKTFAREDAEVRSFARQAREYFGRGMRFAKVFTLEMPVLVLMLGLADLVVVAYGRIIPAELLDRLAGSEANEPIGICTHNLFDEESDPTYQHCKRLGLDNRIGSRRS